MVLTLLLCWWFCGGGDAVVGAPKLYQSKFLVISMLLCVSVPVQRDDAFVERMGGCLRPHSAVVRQLVFKLWRPIFVSHGLQVPTECPLHILRDVYHPHVLETSTYRSDLWMCNLCGKAFESHEYLDMHMENKHKDRMHIDDDSVCLADYCDIFRCRGFLPDNVAGIVAGDYADAHDDIDKFRALYPNFHVLHEHDVGKGELVEAPPPDLLQVLEAQIAERRASLLKENLADGYDDAKPGSTRQRSELETKASPDSKFSTGSGKKFVWRSDTRKRGDGKDSDKDSSGGFFDGFFRAKSTDKANNKKAKQNSLSPTWKSPFESECDQDEMDRLRADCEDLLYSCISPLSLKLNNKAYKSLEIKLHRSVCAFLDCERRDLSPVDELGRPGGPGGWAGGARGRLGSGVNIFRAVSPKIFLLLFLSVGLFLALAYYVVWFCF